MTSTHFSLSFPIKIDMFFPESVVCRYECCGGGTTCNDQWSLLPAAGGLGSLQVPQRVQGRALLGVLGEKPPEALEIL